MDLEMNQPVSEKEKDMKEKNLMRGWGISGSTLKMIAVITMFIDHFAAGVLSRYMAAANSGAVQLPVFGQTSYEELYPVYFVMRMIGRVAFPIYCFLLVEGFRYTRSRLKYAGRLFAFAIISELPFDLLFEGAMLEFTYQNVFFTLFFGLVAMSGLQWADGQDIHSWQKAFLRFAVVIGCMAAAGFAQTDYGAIGVACIIVLYRFRGKKRTQILVGMAVFLWELTAPLAFVPIYYYNQKRGWNLRYFFYFFYPAHLLLLYFLCVALGIASYPAM